MRTHAKGYLVSGKSKKSKALLLSFVFALLMALFTTDVQNSYAQDDDEASALVTASDMEAATSSEDDMSSEDDDTSSDEDDGDAPSSSWAANTQAGGTGSASASPAVSMQQSWIVPSGASVQDVLYQWCQKSGWSLVWNSEYVYTTQAGTTFRGDFLSALKGLFLAMDTATPKLYPVIYKGNKVIVVKNTSSH